MDDKEIYESWFGKYTYNESAHLGYEPKKMLDSSEEEWNEGKPDGDKIGLKTYFLSLQFKGLILNQNFVKEFKNLKINQDYEILISCGTGGRSQVAAEILSAEGYNCSNISDGFLGDNSGKIGWKNNQLPTK